MPAIACHALLKRYRRITALRSLTFSLPVGSSTALVGPNGAGKSTLMRCWLGFERPTKGRVSIHGIDPNRDRSSALSFVGYVPQLAALHPALTVSDHVKMAAQLRPAFSSSEALGRLHSLGIEETARVGELSGGQAAQLALAVTLATGSQILLLDEPLASLDPLARRGFLSVVRQARANRNTTVVLSSHIVTDLVEACDDLLVLREGEILVHESIAALRSTHTVTGEPPQTAQAISTFIDQDGASVWLCLGSEGRPAQIDEIVMGYLAAELPSRA